MSKIPEHDLDEPVTIPLDPEEALKALLQVKPPKDMTDAKARVNENGSTER
jgi:hypothetical protein